MSLRIKADKGELGLALLFAAIGILWVAVAIGLPLWEGFAPQTGFLPLIYGVLLTLLSAGILVNLLTAGEPARESEPVGKPLLILCVLTATVIGLSVAGFALSIFLMLVFLFAVVERLPIVWSVVAAAATTGAMFLIFETWLNVPLPNGPLGI